MRIVKIAGVNRELPETPNEMLARQFVKLTKELERVKLVESVYINTVSMAGVLAEFWEISIDDLVSMEVDPEADLEEMNLPDQVKQYTSIIRIIDNLILIVDNYKPSLWIDGRKSFTYKGTVWEVPTFSISKFNKEYLRPTMEFAKIIRLAEGQRIAAGYIGKKDAIGNDLDPNGNFAFTEFMYVMASLSTNEVMDKQMNFEEKVAYFSDIDMTIAVDMVFFLTSILPTL